MATSAIYLHHERSTQATAEADCQNREIVLDKTNLRPLGRFNDGTLFHVVTQEQPAVALAGALSVALAAALNSTLSVAALATLTGGGVVAAATDSASKLQIGGSVSGKNTALTGNTTLDATHHTLECNATAGSFVVTLPAAAGCVGRRYAFHKNDTSANTVTVDANASETIDGVLTIVLGGNVGNSHLIIESNGTNWRIEWLYEEGSFTATLSNCSSGGTGTVTYTRSGKQITLMIPQIRGTSNGASGLITGVPASITPAQAIGIAGSYLITDNTTPTTSTANYLAEYIAVLTVSSTIQLYKNGGTAFTAAGLKGLSLISVPATPAIFSFSYTLQ